jgi:TfoX/Sxy family transcriptional regulator of competence genes
VASDLSFIEFVIDQIENAGDITYKKMFGEYGLYSDGKIMALVCDNQLFIKPTKAGRTYIENLVESPPYPGAKLYFLITDQLENRNWISELIRITVAELPEPKPKQNRSRRRLK